MRYSSFRSTVGEAIIEPTTCHHKPKPYDIRLDHGGPVQGRLERTVGEEISITAADGGTFAAYLALPARTPAAGLIVLPEIFNSNAHIRSVTDGYAADGFVALAPDVYWRQEAGSYLPYTDEGRTKAR